MIYFIQEAGLGAIKIGYAKDISQRLSTIQVCCPSKIDLLGVIEGNHSEEEELHFLFKKDRIRGEWFNIGILKAVQEIIGRGKIFDDDVPLEVQKLRELDKGIRQSKDESIINHLVYQKEMLFKNLWTVNSEVVI